MRVKRLEIQGFKSFKDKTVIHFDHSITGIVGPNGCGKSNIVDAFFWVMGEQSYKHMRGSSSEDLIFNGSSKYSPLGIAEATLVMETEVENIDPPSGATVQDIPLQLKSREISVTRRLYRSGEGEYFINGTQARLKDIQELFMDTGVGAKGYSVIEQGQIGKIVNAKPEERRLLIEEAAGIAKYKARKKESLRKMEATQANLARLTDIIQEIEKNLDSLERQAQKARLYQKYKDELFEKEITWGRRKARLFREKLETLKKQKETFEQELVGFKAELQSAENLIEVDRITLLTDTKTAEDLQIEIQDLADQLSQEKSSLELSRRRQEDLSSQLAALESEKTELEGAITQSTEDLVNNETETQGASARALEITEKADRLFEEVSLARHGIGEVRHALDEKQRNLKEATQKVSLLSAKSASLQGTAQAAQAHAQRLEEQLQIQKERAVEIHQELEVNREKAGQLVETKAKLAEERRTLSSRKETEDAELRKNRSLQKDAEHEYTQVLSKLQSLEELDASFEGLKDGTRSVLEWAKTNGKADRIKALTDTVQISSGFEVVFQSWLENQIENLLADDSSLALEQIHETLTQKKGRVSFQLHSQAGPGTRQKMTAGSAAEVKKFLVENGFEVCGELSEFVKIKTEYSDLLTPWIQNTFVIETSEPLSKILETERHPELKGWNLAAKDGVVLENNGILRGGSLDSTGTLSILRRKHQIEELKKETDKSKSKLDEAQEHVALCEQKLEATQAAIYTIQTETQNIEIETAALNRDIHQTERALADAQSLEQRLNQEFDQIQTESKEAIEEQTAIEEELQGLKENQLLLEENLVQTQGLLAEKDTSLRAEEEQLQQIKIQQASLQERAQSLKREYDAAKSLIQDRSRRLQEILRTLDRASQEKTRFSGDEGSLAERIETLTLSLHSSRERLSDVKDRIEQCNSRVNDAMEKIKTLHKTGDERVTESTQVALDIEKLTGEISHLTLNLEEKYGAGCLEQKQVAIEPNGKSNGTPDGESTVDAVAPPEAAVGMEPPTDPYTDGEQQELGAPITPTEISAEEEQALGEEVDKLRERIRRLGEVNVMAIEEYEILKKRHDHLLSEKADLVKSLENLQQAIEHINTTSEDRFKKAFEAIADRFARLFPIIFGGGQAKLSLVYPEGSTDILEAGVDILAQPPGKKIVNITLLSGGEKALTAVSLIFAIFMVKPSPFCVLDEVDAPLDDANIGKFNALLKEMSARSQFILITHNKKTMELNDTLYGVTMEEPGVSKMVSIEMH